jgi:hypothetical protein
MRGNTYAADIDGQDCRSGEEFRHLLRGPNRSDGICDITNEEDGCASPVVAYPGTCSA